MPVGVAVPIDIHFGVAPLHPIGRHQAFVKGRPVFPRILGAVTNPDDMTAAPPQTGSEPVDVRHDLSRQRNFALVTRLDEIVLHIDHQHGGLAWLDGVERMQLAHSCGHAVECGGRDRDLVHRCVLN